MTLWHKNANSTYSRFVFQHSVITEVEGQKISGSQRTDENNVRVRLFTVKQCPIETGDRLILGYSVSDEPPEDAYIISSLKKNFDVSPALRHYRAECV